MGQLRREIIAGGGDDRFDEFAVRILVAALYQLRQRMSAIGFLVVGTVEIERADRVMLRPNLIDRTEAVLEMLRRIAERRRFTGGDVFAEPAGRIDARSGEPVWAGQFGRGRDDENLLRPSRCCFFK